MSHLILSEIKKLTSTVWFWIVTASAVVLPPVSAIANVLGAGRNGTSPLGTTANVHHILSSTALTSMLAIGVGIASSAGEFRHGTAIPTFLATPRRRRVVIAKAALATAYGSAVGAVGFATGVAAAVPALHARGIHHLAGDTLQMWLGATIASALFGTLGVAIGTLTRSTVAAIVAVVVWSQFVEMQLLAAVAPAVDAWFPTAANVSVTRSADHLDRFLSPVAGGALLVMYALGGLITAAVVMTRRDV